MQTDRGVRRNVVDSLRSQSDAVETVESSFTFNDLSSKLDERDAVHRRQRKKRRVENEESMTSGGDHSKRIVNSGEDDSDDEKDNKKTPIEKKKQVQLKS